MAGLSDLGNGQVVKAVTGTYQVLQSDSILICTPNAASTVVTLPAAAACTGQLFLLVQVKTSSDQILVKSAGGTIDGTAAATGLVIAPVSVSGAMMVVSDGTNWFIVGSDGNTAAH